MLISFLRLALRPSSPFSFNDTATAEIYTLSLHDALPIFADLLERTGEHLVEVVDGLADPMVGDPVLLVVVRADLQDRLQPRSEEHTSELQSQSNLVCRLLLEKKKNLEDSYA